MMGNLECMRRMHTRLRLSAPTVARARPSCPSPAPTRLSLLWEEAGPSLREAASDTVGGDDALRAASPDLATPQQAPGTLVERKSGASHVVSGK